MEGLVILLALALLALPVLALVALVVALGLRSRVAALEVRIDGLVRELALRPVETPATSPVAPPVAPDQAPPPVSPARTAGSATQGPPPEEPPPATARPAAPPPMPGRATPQPAPHVARPDPITTLLRMARRWIMEGNVPVKVGMLVLFAGVAALLKYASDQGLLRMPIELRLAGIALAAVGGLVFGWRQRVQRRSFALALQGGAVGVLLLVVFAAFKLYALVPAGLAFGLSVVLVAGLGVLAVRQEALALAVLGTLAGFLAPIWLSTGAGSHVALFSYYALLNAGILAIAWRRPWRLLNLLGFAFTFGIGTAWGVLRYRPEQFWSTEPFLLLFFAMYLLIPILYAAARAPGQRRVLDGCLLFGTPLIAFSLQAGLLQGERLPLAFCALGLAAIYLALAAGLRRREAFESLVAPYAVLAVGFATLAVPLAVSAQAAAGLFALEGAGLVWLGLRQQRRLPLVSGLGLQVAAAVALALGDGVAWKAPALLNGPVMAALLIALSGLAIATVAWRAGRLGIALATYCWGLSWWLGTLVVEAHRVAAPPYDLDLQLLVFIVTGWLAAEAFRRVPARALPLTTAVMLVLPALLVWEQMERELWPTPASMAVWAAYAVLGWRALACLRPHGRPERAVAHGSWWLALAWAATLMLPSLTARALPAMGWGYAVALLPWLMLGAALVRRPAWVATPFGADFTQWRPALTGIVAIVVSAGLLFGLLLEGSAAPLPYVPVLNPLELAQFAAVAVIAARMAGEPRVAGLRLPVIAAGLFLLLTSVLLRAAHFWGDAPWSLAMFSTGLVQTCLTLLWSVLGMAAWVVGSRRGRRDVWQAGAVLMALVLAKLVLVDRQYLGNLLGIGSFLGFGLLCTAVGYLAPVPPRRVPAEGSAA